MTASNLPRILVVDDETRHMTALCHTLNDNGYEAVGFSSGQAALAALREKSFDLLLTDLMMPEMDGITLMRAAREIDSGIVGVLMTGHGTIETAVESMKSGALDYILKPFKLSAVLGVLDRALTVRRLRAENASLTQRLQERTAQLEESNRELDAFASTVAHDLHSPARHMAGYARLLLDEAGETLNERVMRRVQSIAEAAERMGQMIADLLGFSRLAREEMMLRAVDMEVLVADVRRDLEAEQAGREMVWDVTPLPTVQGDKSMLRQVVWNLLSNAVKYTRGKFPSIIRVSCRKENEEFIFAIQDNGAGFDMQYAERLFTLFQRLHHEDEFEGTGVGLSIVQRILRRHGGRIWAESKVGEGATFSFALPVPAPVHQGDA